MLEAERAAEVELVAMVPVAPMALTVTMQPVPGVAPMGALEVLEAMVATVPVAPMAAEVDSYRLLSPNRTWTFS